MSNLEKSLAKTLSGTVLPQMVRCGKPNCRCSRGHLHGPYYYRFWREDGKLHKEYVPPNKQIPVRNACNTRRQLEKQKREELKLFRELFQEPVSNVQKIENPI